MKSTKVPLLPAGLSCDNIRFNIFTAVITEFGYRLSAVGYQQNLVTLTSLRMEGYYLELISR